MSIASGIGPFDLNDPVASTAVCIFSSAVAGTGIGLFGCVLSLADKLRSDNGGDNTRRSKNLTLLGAIGSTIFGIASLVGLFFGPVSLVVVVRAGSTLPANALFSSLFGLRQLIREDYLGIIVTIGGVICFALFQGQANNRIVPDVLYADLARPGSIFFLSFMFAVLVFSLALTAKLSAIGPSRSYYCGVAANTRKTLIVVCVTNICSTSSAFMDLSTKAWGAALTQGVMDAVGGGLFWMAIFANVSFLVAMRMATIYGCARTDVMVFVPMNTIANIVYSSTMGFVVLQEWVSVNSFMGLGAAFLSLMCGIVLLIAGPSSGFSEGADDDSESSDSVSEIDFGPDKSVTSPFGPEQQEPVQPAKDKLNATGTPSHGPSRPPTGRASRRSTARAARGGEESLERGESAFNALVAARGNELPHVLDGVKSERALSARPRQRTLLSKMQEPDFDDPEAAPSHWRNYAISVLANDLLEKEERLWPQHHEKSQTARDRLPRLEGQSIFDLHANSSVALTRLNRAQQRQAIRRLEVEDMRRELHEMAGLLRVRQAAHRRPRASSLGHPRYRPVGPLLAQLPRKLAEEGAAPRLRMEWLTARTGSLPFSSLLLGSRRQTNPRASASESLDNAALDEQRLQQANSLRA